MYIQSYKFATNWLSWKDPSQTQSKKRNTADVELVAVIFCSIFITVRNSATKFAWIRGPHCLEMKTDPGHLSKTHRYVKIW